MNTTERENLIESLIQDLDALGLVKNSPADGQHDHGGGDAVEKTVDETKREEHE